MNITVKQGKYQVMQTGSILVSNNESTKIIIDNNYTIEVKYTDDTDNKEPRISASPNDSGVILELINFGTPLGTTLRAPLPIATQGDQVISISLTLTTIGAAKILLYGIYVEEDGVKNA